MARAPDVTGSEMSGCTFAYARDETQFPVYVLAIVAAVLLAVFLAGGAIVALILGVIAAAAAYYNFPLLETGRPRLGANQYGVFIEGFGILRWRAIKRIDLVPIAVRAMTVHELQIALDQPLPSALVADWRRMPFYRLLMRLPWTMTHDNVIRVKLDPFDHTPADIHRTLSRMWRYYRS